MSEMQPKEIRERFTEGLKQASSRARELAVSQKDRGWNNFADQIDQLLNTGIQFYSQRALSRTKVLSLLDEIENRKKAMN